MNTGIEVAASLVECCIFVRLCNGFLGFKSETRETLIKCTRKAKNMV